VNKLDIFCISAVYASVLVPVRAGVFSKNPCAIVVAISFNFLSIAVRVSATVVSGTASTSVILSQATNCILSAIVKPVLVALVVATYVFVSSAKVTSVASVVLPVAVVMLIFFGAVVIVASMTSCIFFDHPKVVTIPVLSTSVSQPMNANFSFVTSGVVGTAVKYVLSTHHFTLSSVSTSVNIFVLSAASVSQRVSHVWGVKSFPSLVTAVTLSPSVNEIGVVNAVALFIVVAAFTVYAVPLGSSGASVVSFFRSSVSVMV